MSVLPASTFYAFGTEESYSYPRRRRRRRIHPQPGQDLHLLSLGKGGRFTARGSGPEPKIKSHLFANQKVASAAELPAVKTKVGPALDDLSKLSAAEAKAWAQE